MKKFILSIFILFSMYTNLQSFDSEKAGDILRIVIPISAYTPTLYLNDKEGQMQFYKSLATNVLTTYALKYTINRKRPNGEDYSFPSGHTSISFQGATFIHRRYGFNYSIPLYIAATYVAYTRVQTDNHYVGDVIAGALIGSLSSLYFTTNYKGYEIKPLAKDSSYGISIGKNF